jgi:hypothetical protein
MGEQTAKSRRRWKYLIGGGILMLCLGAALTPVVGAVLEATDEAH